MTSSPYFDNICTLPLPSDLFCQALHPTQPILTVGLASGHVLTYRLPSTEEDTPTTSQPESRKGSINGTSSILSQRRRSSTASENGLGSIETIWKTRRHKGSCRALVYSLDGNICYSGGTDGLIKAFETETGRVVSKIALPLATEDADEDAPTVIHVLTPLHLLVATDSGSLYVYELKDEGRTITNEPSQTHQPHGEEHINTLFPIPPSSESTSGYPKQFITVGGSTLAVIDIRRGIIATSEDQEIELLSLSMVSGLKSGGTSVGTKVLAGQSDGVISLFERGAWGDLDERIVVDREGASIDVLCEVPLGFLPRMGKLKMNEKIVAAGLDDGRIRFVRIGRNNVVHEWDLKHDELEGVTSILFDEAGTRMITAGGSIVKVWTKASPASEATLNVNGTGKRRHDADSVEDEEDDDDSDDQEQEVESEDEEGSSEGERGGRRKKRKRNKGKDKSGGKALSLSGMF